ncbi:hypothetical protein BJX66DRAFT_305116 [Aspergillus keveii]|uniref:Uncharacterized protein n=1 Tax=Aspergillus keveii TaxID=714993 RepID=A0ABR4G5N0_9EURO
MMIWNAEANVKLLVGMLAQLRDQSVKLDYKKLAEHMGPECNAKSVMNQFTRLKKQAAEAAEGMSENKQASGGADDETPPAAKGAATKKRKAAGASGKGSSAKKKNKKAKAAAEVEEDDEEMAGE